MDDRAVQMTDVGKDLPIWSKVGIYLIERIGLPVMLLGIGGYYFVEHLHGIRMYLERAAAVQEKFAAELGANRQLLEKIAAKLEKLQ